MAEVGVRQVMPTVNGAASPSAKPHGALLGMRAAPARPMVHRPSRPLQDRRGDTCNRAPWLEALARNVTAVRLYERLAFRVVQGLADVERVDGQSWSALQMSFATTDWPAAPDEQWLAAARSGRHGRTSASSAGTTERRS
ncbi:hypothetical protein ACIF8W_05090 [Streptomyces sp. NPDC085639]|uniref:hypothetical protein n=1 Tax=Streptomyces sp. NPDC085639 TaxID=3365734 RepID=UPI0037CD8D3C